MRVNLRELARQTLRDRVSDRLFQHVLIFAWKFEAGHGNEHDRLLRIIPPGVEIFSNLPALFAATHWLVGNADERVDPELVRLVAKTPDHLICIEISAVFHLSAQLPRADRRGERDQLKAEPLLRRVHSSENYFEPSEVVGHIPHSNAIHVGGDGAPATRRSNRRRHRAARAASVNARTKISPRVARVQDWNGPIDSLALD